MGLLVGRVAIITGASRGVGRALALRFASEGAAVVVAAKSTTEDPRIPGTIHETAEAVRATGARALAVRCDVRLLSDLERLVSETKEQFGRVDILVNNAGAIWVEPIENTPEKRFDLVMAVNFKGPFFLSQLVIPMMKESGWGHIINMSPPVQPAEAAFKIAYMTSKFGMTLLAHGLGRELAGTGVACNALWPRTLVESLAVKNWHMGKPEDWRKPEILADAAVEILRQDPRVFTGHALIDEDVLRKAGTEDFSRYAVVPGSSPRSLDWNELQHVIQSFSEQQRTRSRNESHQGSGTP